MKRFLLSVLLGGIPAVILLVLRHPSPVPQTTTVPEPPAEHSTPPPDPKAFDDWQIARARSDADSLRYLETLESGGARALLERVEMMEDGDERKTLRTQAFERWAEIDLMAALEYADAKWPALERIGVVRSSVLKWAHEDIDACWKWIAKTEASLDSSEDNKGVWESFLRNLYAERAFAIPTRDEEARTWRELERCSANLETVGAIIPREGVFFDPLTKAPAGSMWTVVLTARERRAWSGAVTRILALPGINAPLMTQVAHDWVWHDMEGAILWASNLEDPAQRKLVFMAMSPAQNQGEGTAPRFDRAAYFRTLAALAPDRVSDEFDHWNPVEASAWLAESIDTLPSPDLARASLANALAKQDVAAAVAWTESIVSETQRELTIQYVAREWARHEPWAATAWAKEALGWTDEECVEKLRLDR
jgi:hypothetical protein